MRRSAPQPLKDIIHHPLYRIVIQKARTFWKKIGAKRIKTDKTAAKIGQSDAEMLSAVLWLQFAVRLALIW